jgi:hypothetical protein
MYSVPLRNLKKYLGNALLLIVVSLSKSKIKSFLHQMDQDLQTLCEDHQYPILGLEYNTEYKNPMHGYCSKCIENTHYTQLANPKAKHSRINLRDLQIIVKEKVPNISLKDVIIREFERQYPTLLTEITDIFRTHAGSPIFEDDEGLELLIRQNQPLYLQTFSQQTRLKLLRRVKYTVDKAVKEEAKKMIKDDYGRYVRELQNELQHLLPPVNEQAKEWPNLAGRLKSIQELQRSQNKKFPLIGLPDFEFSNKLFEEYRKNIFRSMAKKFLDDQRALIQDRITDGIEFAMDFFARPAPSSTLTQPPTEPYLTPLTQESSSSTEDQSKMTED